MVHQQPNQYHPLSAVPAFLAVCTPFCFSFAICDYKDQVLFLHRTVVFDFRQERVMSCFTSIHPRFVSDAGLKLLVVHCTDTSLYALSRRRQLCVAVAQLPFGTAVVTFGRATLPPLAVTALECCWQTLRRI